MLRANEKAAIELLLLLLLQLENLSRILSATHTAAGKAIRKREDLLDGTR